MATFKVRIAWVQEVTVRVLAPSPRDAEALALRRLEANELPREDILASVRRDVEVEEGRTEVVG
jgi:phage-related baseplate assembly protein